MIAWPFNIFQGEKPRDLHSAFDRDASFGQGRGGAVTCGTAAVRVLPGNRLRKRAVLVNDSDAAIYLFKGDPVNCAINAGMRLNASGGSWTETPDPLGYIYRGPFSAITTAADKVLTFLEET